jgi:hypothetical protein
MIQTSIDRTDSKTGGELAIPRDVVSIVEAANRILLEQLPSLTNLTLNASWCRFEEIPGKGWCVYLDIFTAEYSYGQQLRVNDLRHPAQAKELIREVLWEFAQTYSEKVGEEIQKIRAGLKQLLAVGAA